MNYFDEKNIYFKKIFFLYIFFYLKKIKKKLFQYKRNYFFESLLTIDFI